MSHVRIFKFVTLDRTVQNPLKGCKVMQAKGVSESDAKKSLLKTISPTIMVASACCTNLYTS
ncbi:TPA: hypothetical protein I7730_00895 [Vibrio vulnificus]|uniref:Uncharacterized protein n=1 Tax=Vibrio vulnificus TaxID=672 RepID=A0A8H9K5N8_VIBVL|nr:hypothetical protein [Vibrio vulnificus]